ncbi:MAG: thermonuclease family protein [Candidatus Marinimicrobia bacterium]|nr:thermonuclease family protein [Candidatus Neomarinimicrobiota bacterium]MBL7010655.1 thermonuclease family protein [Candidatus Neomarinimicrobiota bacterium]MBL7030467.1 thermonuclease family protein [Candidatus Neomarinimicrobiota bacterium]
MGEIQDNSIDLVVTSPPYWQLKDYGNENQIGFDDSYEDYINNLNLVWNESFRALDDGCRLCVNIGDQFARSVYYGRYKVIPIRTEIIKFCETVGFDYMGAIIWQKMTTSNTSGGASIMGSYPYPRNGILKIDYEFILLFKKPGKPKKIEKEIKEKSKMTSKEWNTYFSGHWNFSGEKQKNHLAMFPLELPNRLIKMFSFVGDTILDPFLGSGTTALSASNLNRNSVGYEINSDFLPIIKDKLSDVSNIEIIKNKPTKDDFKKEIINLPYIFKDTVKIDKKVDPRKNKFGSKIDQNSNGDTIEYYSIKEIHSPNELTLNNGLRIKLIGVKPIKTKEQVAQQFIADKTKGQKVFLKHDAIEFDNNKNRLCYLYLKNKTFINAHLIKTGLAKTDNGFDYKHYKRFLKYEESAP